jgi:hypothetical protein
MIRIISGLTIPALAGVLSIVLIWRGRQDHGAHAADGLQDQG